MNIEITDESTATTHVLDVGDVVLARHLPDGDGTLTYLCPSCPQVAVIPLTCEEVMAAVFAGVSPVDVER